MKKSLLWIVVLLLSVSMVAMFTLAGCEKGGAAVAEEEEAEEAPAADEETTAAGEALTFGYVSKLLTHEWFQVESSGIKKFCDEKGIEYIAADANLDDEKCLELVDELITKGIDALMITATSMGMGPSVTEKCKSAGIPVVTIDDPLQDQDGNTVPHVGMPTFEVGYVGGEGLAELANERDFFKEGNIVKVLHGISSKLPTCTERADGAKDALLKNTTIDEQAFLEADIGDSGMDDALVGYSAVVSANPDATHWIAYGCNDDCGVGAIRIFEEIGISRDNFLSMGIGGYGLGLEELEKGNSSYITVTTRPDIEGYKAAEEIYLFLTENKPLEENIFVSGNITSVDDYKESPWWNE